MTICWETALLSVMNKIHGGRCQDVEAFNQGKPGKLRSLEPRCRGIKKDEDDHRRLPFDPKMLEDIMKKDARMMGHLNRWSGDCRGQRLEPGRCGVMEENPGWETAHCLSVDQASPQASERIQCRPC